MLRRSTVTTDTDDSDLQSDAELAARGDELALDRLFAAIGGSAWGIAFSAADAVSPATVAVAAAFTETLQLFDSGLATHDVKTEVLHATRLAALAGAANDEPEEPTVRGGDGRHAREPVSLLGETNDRQATLAFTALPEPMRSALWLVECERLSISRTSRLLDLSFKAAEDIVRQARAGFRRYYVEAIRREGLDRVCVATLEHMAAYLNRSLNAGDMAAIEHHLAGCDHCRGAVTKLDDLESCLRDAIPQLPAWTRQLVADQWSEIAPTNSEMYNREPRVWWLSTSRHSRVMAGAAAAVVIFGAVALLGRLGGDDSSINPQLATADSTQLDRAFDKSVSTLKINAPTSTSTAPAVASTPAPEVETTVAPTTAPPTTVHAADAPTTVAPPTSTVRRLPTTTSTSTTTTVPPATTTPPTVPPTTATTSLTLVDVPPVARLVTPAGK